MPEFIHLKRWECPRDFLIGHDDMLRRMNSFSVIGRNHDSDTLGNSNYVVMLELLRRKEEALGGPQGEFPWVWDDRDHHWFCGWVEEIYVDVDAPEELLMYADELLENLAQYPVLNEDGYAEAVSQAVSQAVYDYWDGCSHGERLGLIMEHCEVGEEEAEALTDGGIPEEVYDAIQELID